MDHQTRQWRKHSSLILVLAVTAQAISFAQCQSIEDVTLATEALRNVTDVCRTDQDLMLANERNLRETFGARPDDSPERPMDLVFIIDRSASIQESGWNRMVENIRFLISYLASPVHPDYTRVAVLSYGKQTTKQFDGISLPTRAHDHCSFDILLDTIGYDKNADRKVSSRRKVFILLGLY